MTRALMTTTALGLALAATTASANEWEVKVGGYMEQYVAYADSDVRGLNDANFSGVDSKGNAEIRFQPSLTLDNGLKVGARIVLEGATSGDQIDKAYLFLDGSFGRVELGSQGSAGYNMFYAAPDVTFMNVNSGSTTNYIPFSGGQLDANADGDFLDAGDIGTGNEIFRGTLGATYLENGGDTNGDQAQSNAQRFTYYTPRLAGFQVGLSYARDNREDNNAQLNLDGNRMNNLFDVGANYVMDYGNGWDVALAGRWGIASDDATGANNPQVYGGGLQVGYNGIRVGGSFAEQNNSISADGTAWDVGISYSTGPWGVSFTYISGENTDNELNDGAGIDVPGSDETLDQYLLGVSYALATGVNLNAFGAYVDFQEDNGNAGAGTPGNDVDGWVIGTGIKIEF